MNRFLFLLSGLMLGITMVAAPVSKTAAQEKARHFMLERGMIADGTAVEETSIRRAPSAGAAPSYYVFNAGNDRGFVIVAGDDVVDSILGYCDNGSFCADSIPENVEWWLSNMETEIRWMQDHQPNDARPHRAPKPAISPLLTTKWDQGKPYNLLCPGNSYTGCVATAMAQVMNYHQWPDTTLTEVPGTTAYGDTIDTLPIIGFDWKAMRNTYRGNDSDGMAVAELMLYAGCSVSMSYSTSGSGAYSENVPHALVHYFGYDSGLKLEYRSNYSIAEWDDMMYNELANNRPVYYSGASMSVGHAFVCDGYDGHGLFHINWGWSGRFDGHFKLSVLNPNSNSGAGSGSTPDGYANQQCALFGVQKPTGEEPVAPPSLPDLLGFEVLNNTLEVTFEKRWGERKTYDCAIAMEKADGSYEILSQDRFQTIVQNRRNLYCRVDTLLTEVGDYKIVPLGRESSETEWRRVGRSYEYIVFNVTSENDSLEYSYVIHPVFNLKATSIEPVGTVTANNYNPLRVTLVNEGDEYNGMIYVYACSEDVLGQSYPHGYTTVALEAGSTTDLTFYYQPSTLTDMAIWLYAESPKGYYLDFIGQREFATYDLEFVSSTVEYDPLVVSVTVKNNSPTDYNRTFRTFVFQEGKKKRLGTADKTQLIPAGGETTFVYDTFRLTPGVDYYMLFQVQDHEIGNSFVYIDGRVDIDGSQTSGIEVQSADQPQTDWYSVSGVRVGQPSAKGIFIRGGKKFVR